MINPIPAIAFRATPEARYAEVGIGVPRAESPGSALGASLRTPSEPSAPSQGANDQSDRRDRVSGTRDSRFERPQKDGPPRSGLVFPGLRARARRWVRP